MYPAGELAVLRQLLFNLETAVVQVGGFVITPPTCTTAGSSSYYEILHIACMLYYMFLFYLFIFFYCWNFVHVPCLISVSFF